MSIDKILHKNTILQLLKIEVSTFQILRDEVVHLEIKENIFSPKIIGTLKFKDSFNFTKIIDTTTPISVKISMTDFLGDSMIRSFKVTNMEKSIIDERTQIIDLELQDEITFLLENTYLSKSFSSTPVSAFKEYLTYLGIDEIITEELMSYDIVDTSASQSFVVPQNTNVLDFFENLFRKENIRIFQNKKTFSVKEIIPNSMEILIGPEKDEITFTNVTTNNLFLFKVHDLQEISGSTGKINKETPNAKRISASTNKEIVDNTINISDYSQELKLNETDPSKFNLTKGSKFITQEYLTLGNQKADLFEKYMLSNSILVVVPGTISYSVVGSIVNAELKGVGLHNDISLEGSPIGSGKYLVSGLSDRILGDKLIQRLSLSRADSL